VWRGTGGLVTDTRGAGEVRLGTSGCRGHDSLHDEKVYRLSSTSAPKDSRINIPGVRYLNRNSMKDFGFVPDKGFIVQVNGYCVTVSLSSP
jgi:hypothetical protein